MRQLGKLEKVEAKEIWPREASDFTPWLKENISYLSEAIGLDIEITESEGSVGSFSVDLVGQDLGSGRTIVIENQLTSTDHTHLGQLLTYAAGRKAGVAIWITSEFRDEHRMVLEWLNTMSDGQQGFFGVQIRAYKIGNSPPAPHFEVVARPNEWVRPPPPPSDKSRAYQQFFAELLDDIKQAYPTLTSAKRIYPTSWISLPIGRTGFSNGISFAQGSRLRAEIYINWQFRKAFYLLRDMRDEIEKEIGEELNWEELPKDTRIAIYTEGSILDPPERLIELREWAIEKVGQFDKSFRHRIAALPKNLESDVTIDDAKKADES